ncbi:hypothetical protein OESDEN_19324 [Oesophagostomum dentatum]|uniref:Uncharacterized protein n=1 Tax=Oesophagostomum dentatum TaxID=61180 RepID=A0A0B1S7T7_OESDE|nr:hypothetical protein OESDEN_19324 [Oesophagostomum dentatum]
MKSTGSCSHLDRECPEGSKCDVGPVGGGICCDAKNEEEWDKERHPKCKQGTLSKRTEWYGEVTRFGKNCSHKFCPSGYKCIQMKRLAHCCSEH